MGLSMSLETLIAGLVRGRVDRKVQVTGLSADSRTVAPGDLFFAARGLRFSGQDFIAEAVARGAVAVFVESPWHAGQGDAARVPVFAVPDLRRVQGLVADRFFGRPSSRIPVIGVTGTNGKTSVTHFLAQALGGNGCGAGCAVVGTLGWGYPGSLKPTAHTTPDSITLHRLLAQLVEDGAAAVAMEVSSHGIEQQRIAGVRFAVTVFTNLSHDHLDYHRTFAEYREVKARLFRDETLPAAVMNWDDAHGRHIAREIPRHVRIVGYSLQGRTGPGEWLNGQIQQYSAAGLTLHVRSAAGEATLVTPLLGDFNACNLLAAMAAMMARDIDFAEVVERAARVRPLPGRMERFGGEAGMPLVVVDYAHTPDGLEKALRSLRILARGRLICVFGCGGDRDAGKRPLMGEVASRLADRVIVTDDNPRSESPQVIAAQVVAGARERPVAVIHDRAEAIGTAIGEATGDDVVLVAGKGHETWQDCQGERTPFSDRETVRSVLAREFRP